MMVIKKIEKTMKRLQLYVMLLLMTGLANSCIKNEEALINNSTVEFDAAAFNANASGLTYPIVTRVPGFGRAISTSVDPTLNKNSGTINLRINLVGPQKSTDTEVSYQIVSSASTAVAGVHYTAPSGTVIIPANSSFGELSLQVLNLGSAPPSSVVLVLEITSATNNTLPSENYKMLGLRIAQ
jgi:hypothetical protein